MLAAVGGVGGLVGKGRFETCPYLCEGEGFAGCWLRCALD